MRQLFDRKIYDIKKYIIILTLFTCLLLSACGKTEQAESIPKAPSVEGLKTEAESSPESELKFQPESYPSEEPPSEIPNPEPSQKEDTHPYDFTICFAGDINLDENWCTTQYLNTRENGIKDCISP